MSIYRCLFVLLLLVAFFSNSVFAANETQDELMKKGIYQFRQESYDEALISFSKVSEKYPNSSLAVYYLGLTNKRLENYIVAKQYLERSLTMKPKIKGALMELIDLLYRLGDYEEAKKWIAIAEEEGIRPAQAKFLKGLTLQKNEEYEGSVQAFKDAKDLDDRLTQSADYQIGICYMKLKQFGNARDAFRDVFEVDPYSSVAGFASKYIDAIERKMESERPFHFLAGISFEYDSNVVLEPTDSSLIASITDSDDTREVYDLKADYTFRTEDNFASLKAGYGLRISKQNDFGAYDTISNNFSLQGNLSYEKLLITFPVGFTHTIVDDDPYLGTVSAGNINNLMVGSNQMAQAGIIYKYNDYLKSSSISTEDRTGNDIMGTCGWFWFFSDNKGFINLRYSLNKNYTKGENWENLGNKVGAGVLFPFADKFKVSVNGEGYFQNYDNTHTIYGKKRKDQTYGVGSLLSYEIMKNFEFQVKYTYVNERSNLKIYEYDRHMVSTGVQFKY
jgi:tetratricopeptide (TPR) repeat protein